MPSKRPYLAFYVRDWLGDSSVTQLTARSRAVWFDLLCRMFEQQVDHLDVTLDQITRLARCDISDAVAFIEENKAANAAEIELLSDEQALTSEYRVTCRRFRRDLERSSSRKNVREHASTSFADDVRDVRTSRKQEQIRLSIADCTNVRDTVHSTITSTNYGRTRSQSLTGKVSDVTDELLSDEAKLMQWIELARQRGTRGVDRSQASLIRVASAAKHCLAHADNPARLFAWLLRERKWENISQESEDAALDMLKRFAEAATTDLAQDIGG